jgi:hypothetical protein
MTTHNPAAWKASAEIVRDSDGDCVAVAYTAADARLIASSPDLMHSAVAIVNTIVGQAPVITDSGMMQVWISIEELNLLRAAIAKATEA